MDVEIITEGKIREIKTDLEFNVISNWYVYMKSAESNYRQIVNSNELDFEKYKETVMEKYEKVKKDMVEISEKIEVLKKHIGERLRPCYECRRSKDNWHCDMYKENNYCNPGNPPSISDFDEIGLFSWRSASNS